MAARAGRVFLGVAVAAAVLAAAAAARGDAARGRQVFEAKQCARCHAANGEKRVGPALSVLKRAQGAYELAGRLWNHAPAMTTLFVREGAEWRTISQAEMADLMDYLEADPARDPAVDRLRGVAALVGKGCLKCHRLRGEGGRDAPDFAAVAPAFSPPSAWAARVWSHSPRMAAIAAAKGVRYPRFSRDEMAQLVAYLKDATGR